MESVKQRIADLESAGKVVGGLSLSSEFELACLRELVAVTEQRDAVVAENVVLKEAIKEHSEGFIPCNCCGMEHDSSHDDVCRALNETPATDAAIAALRAEAFNDLCKAFVLHKQSACLDDHDKVSVREATDALLHCAEQLSSQLRESKGEVSNG